MLGLGHVPVVEGSCQLLSSHLWCCTKKNTGQEQNDSVKSSYHVVSWQIREIIWMAGTFQ